MLVQHLVSTVLKIILWANNCVSKRPKLSQQVIIVGTCHSLSVFYWANVIRAGGRCIYTQTDVPTVTMTENIN